MRDYVIITDVTCDLPPDVLEKLDIRVIPMDFIMGGEVYRHYPDAREMSFEQFYQRMAGGEMPTTSMINPEVYTRYFDAILGAGKDVLYIGFSSGLSGTYQSSQIIIQDMREKYPEGKILSVDSVAASVGEGLLVWLAAQKKHQGLTLEELHKWIEENRCHVCQWFTVDDLNHLRRGGRISAVAAVAGSALGIKPVLHVDEEGCLTPMAKVRGRKKAVDTLIDKMARTSINPGEQIVLVGHGNCEKEARELKAMVKERFHPKEIIVCDIGPIIGSHVGPGILALVFWGSEK